MIDLHLIGHSEGTVINSQVIQLLNKNNAWTPGLKAGYLKVTMLDPHAANNGVRGQQYSVSNGLLGQIARMEIDAFQSKAKDPAVVVPPNVQDAEVFYQHTPVSQVRGLERRHLQPLGTGAGSRPGVLLQPDGPRDQPRRQVRGAELVRGQRRSHPGQRAPRSSRPTPSPPRLVSTTATGAVPLGGQTVEYSGTAGPGATVEVLAAAAGKPTLSLVARTTADAAGKWDATTRPLAAGRYRVVVEANAPDGPRGRPATMKPIVWPGPLTIAPE